VRNHRIHTTTWPGSSIGYDLTNNQRRSSEPAKKHSGSPQESIPKSRRDPNKLRRSMQLEFDEFRTCAGARQQPDEPVVQQQQSSAKLGSCGNLASRDVQQLCDVARDTFQQAQKKGNLAAALTASLCDASRTESCTSLHMEVSCERMKQAFARADAEGTLEATCQRYAELLRHGATAIAISSTPPNLWRNSA